jgi:ATP-dependent helicase/nuclease subunit B
MDQLHVPTSLLLLKHGYDILLEKPFAINEEEMNRLREAAKKYVEELGEDVTAGSPRTKTKIGRLCRAAMPVVDGLCEEFSESLFEPKFFELALKKDDETSPSPITFGTESGDISIYGVIDRVDTYKKGDDVYLRVVDYKTGHKVFSPEDMAEGANLQMFLYLKSLIDTEKEKFKESVGAKEGRLIPAGVIYVKTAVSDVRIDLPDDAMAEAAVKSNQKREGMVLNDPEILEAMKLKYTPVYSERTPDKISSAKEKFLFTEESFSDIMDTVEGAVADVADRMRRGRIEAIPKPGASSSLPCEYCEFKPICRSAVKK